VHIVLGVEFALSRAWYLSVYGVLGSTVNGSAPMTDAALMCSFRLGRVFDFMWFLGFTVGDSTSKQVDDCI